MAHDRRFRFGLQAHLPEPDMTWQDTARKVESLGYSTLFSPDHFGDQFAPVPALTSAAEVTTELKVGALVFDNDYKHPVVLAKEMATLDVLSGGRVEFGLGSGWMRSDYEQSGMPYDPPKVRVERFMEAVDVVRGCFGEGPFDFAGEHYTITGYDALPKPTAPGGPPLLIGAGAKRMLRFAGQHADIVGITGTIASGEIDAEAARDTAADRFDQKVAWLREGAGDRFDDIELNALVFVAQVTDDAAGFAELVAPMFGVQPDQILESPAALIGSVDQICEELERRRERWGLSYHVFQSGALDAMAPVVARLTGT